MKNRVVALASLLCVMGAASAEPLEGPPAGFDIDRLALLLELEDHQKVIVRSILDAQHEEMRTAHEQHRASGVRPSREEMQRRHEALKQSTLSKLQGVLTLEQLAKFEALTERPPPLAHEQAQRSVISDAPR
jgi:hypothetical protein